MKPWHVFLFEGHHYRIKEEDAGATQGRVGFYTWRFVQAESREEAEFLAREDVLTHAAQRLDSTDKSEVTATYEGMREDPDAAEVSINLRSTGIVLYPEKAFVAELMYAFEGLGRRLRGKGGTATSDDSAANAA